MCFLRLTGGVRKFQGYSLPHSGQFRPGTDSYPSDTHFEHGSLIYLFMLQRVR
jgi:hypothetical protein